MTYAEINFKSYFERDGYECAVDAARRNMKIMKEAAKDRRKRYGKLESFRRRYIIQAWDFRKLLIQLNEYLS